ncbi:MAG: 30S ribosomal protein S8, partial [Bifidobacterium crudilactis]|nr:30S ribosomal protein S8 [Bifidobacterium crudilactis]
VDMPYSKFKANIAQILKREGFITDFSSKEAKVGQTLELTLKYGAHGEQSIQGIKRVSKPGLRRYAKSDSLPMPLGGLGIAIISTSAGLLTQKECLDRGIGGEIVAYVW